MILFHYKKGFFVAQCDNKPPDNLDYATGATAMSHRVPKYACVLLVSQKLFIKMRRFGSLCTPYYRLKGTLGPVCKH